MNNFIQIELFNSELPKENLKIEVDDVDWQAILGCSIFTRKEIAVLISRSESTRLNSSHSRASRMPSSA